MPERALIDWIRQRQQQLAGGDVLLGPGDDCALIELAPEVTIALAADALSEGIHFDLEHARPEQVGRKALCVNLSDVAAMGFDPVAATATVGLRPGVPDAVVQGLCEGLWAAAEEFRCPVVGGDITGAADAIHLSVAIIGRGPGGAPFLRSGARVGDVVAVTGTLGGSLAGKHLDFTPRLAEARRLRELGGVTAMIDLSDGLSTDLGHICEESRVGAEIDAAAVPISEAAHAAAEPPGGGDALQHALNDGEDFELLFTLDAAQADQVLAAWDLPTPLTRIGRIVERNQGAVLLRPDGTRAPLDMAGYEHRF